MVQKLENEITETDKGKNPSSPKSRLAVLKRNKKPAGSDPFRFQGQGVFYKGKLIGERDVPAARGDEMCAEAMRSAKASIKAAGAHKTRIQLQINIEGIKILDEKSSAVLHNFPVSRISFVARDASDARAFGLVFGDTQSKYRFYGIKTAQTADQAVLAIRDMFQVVFEMKKKQIEQVKQQQSSNNTTEAIETGVAVADLLDLETELSIIEQGVHQLQQIPTTDAFGAAPFADPFADSFASTNTSVTNSTMNNMSMSSNVTSSFGTPVHHNPTVPFNAFGSPQLSAQQPQAWEQPVVMPVTHSQPVLSTFSETNPFASGFTSSNDPFSDRAAVPTSAKPVVDWGVNENLAPRMPHANSFTAFESNPQKGHNWDDTTKRVTSLEDAFCKLVDMDDLVGPAETKKNPFEHIINPPKASLNSLTARHQQLPTAVTAPADPFGDDFFR